MASSAQSSRALDPRGWKHETLVTDERGGEFPAVVRYGPYLFVSGSDGDRRLSDERIDAELAENAVEQCRNSYGRIARRLERAGFGGDCALWIENFTSGQHWRLERMGLWPEYFGEENHLRAVSFGAQTRMRGVNMLTSVVLAIDPGIERHVAVPSPGRGRASRCTRAGPFTFVIGVRGHQDPITKGHAPEETDTSFDVQLEYALNALESHLSKDGTPLGNFVRVDATLRGARFIPNFEVGIRRRFDGRIPFATYAIGTPLGARGEQEIGGIAVVPGESREIVWSRADPMIADATVAGGLIFLRKVSGMREERSGAFVPGLYGDLHGQVRRAIRNVEELLDDAGSSTAQLLRLDIFLRDIYAQDDVIAELSLTLGDRRPVIAVIGCEPDASAEIAIAAIAGAGKGAL